MKNSEWKIAFVGWVLVITGLACSLTSPTPASWSGTPTAIARGATNTVVALTQAAGVTEVQTPVPTETQEIATRTAIVKPTIPVDGPWLVYPAPSGNALHAFDVDADRIIEIPLPPPIYAVDLETGLSPDHNTLIVRAGSPFNTDEFALYQIDVPTGEVKKITPLLSLDVQRRIVSEEGDRVQETFRAVTRPDALAWSPNGRFLAFSAALDNNSSDLYVYQVSKGQIDRLNGLYSQSASPFWAPESNWLVSQELDNFQEDRGWRTEVVTGLRVPGYDDQRTLYLPPAESVEEVFLGWSNVHNFISYSLTIEGPTQLRSVNVSTLKSGMILPDTFTEAVLDPETKSLGIVLQSGDALDPGMLAGVYFLPPESVTLELQRTGEWEDISWDPGGMFMARGLQGVYAFSPGGESIMLQEEANVCLSPNGNWILAWGYGLNKPLGLRLYQSPSGTFLQQIRSERVDQIFWQPDSLGFFLFGEGSLSRAVFPNLEPELVESGFSLDLSLHFTWIE